MTNFLAYIKPIFMRIVTAILGIILTTGCKKSSPDNDYTITAVVLDIDSRAPIPVAKVYSQAYPIFGSPIVFDSSYSDASGKTRFTHKKGDARMIFAVSKPGYIPAGLLPLSGGLYFVDRTDTSYMTKASAVDLSIHRSNTYLPGDSVYVKVKGIYIPGGFSGFFYTVAQYLANSPDRLINLQAFYSSPYHTKLYFQCDIIRGGTVFSSQLDSAEMIQFGTRNHTLNY